MEDRVEKHITDAQSRGEFDNLTGMGKPLQLENDRLVPQAYRLAYRIMRDYDTQPDWIASAKTIDQDFLNAQEALLKAADRYKFLMSELDGRFDLNSIQARLSAGDKWRNDQRHFCDTIIKINKKITVLNLKVPSFHLTRDLLDPEQELAKLKI